MRNAGGYSQIICDDPGRTIAKDAYGREVPTEADTFTCGHCNKVVFVRPRERPEDIGGLCKQCMKLICPHCLIAGNCTPLEKRLAAQEARYHALRSYGMA